MLTTCARVLDSLPTLNKSDATAVVHSVCINTQNAEAYVLPIEVMGTFAITELNQTAIHGSLSHIFPMSASILPAAALLDSICRLGIGVTRVLITYDSTKEEIHKQFAADSDKQFLVNNDYKRSISAQISLGIYEIICGLATSSLGIYAVTLASAPIGFLTLAIANYLDIIPMIFSGRTEVDEHTRTAQLFKFIEASGYLMLSFGIPAGAMLLLPSTIYKISMNMNASKGGLFNNFLDDIGRLTRRLTSTSKEGSDLQEIVKRPTR